MPDQLICPHCNQPITITEALSNQLKQQMEEEWRKKVEEKEKEINKQLEEAKKREEELKKQQSELDEQVKKKTEEQLQAIKKEMWEKAQNAAGEKFSLQLKDLEEQLKEKAQKADELEKNELELRKKQRELEEEKKEFELKLMRQMDEKRKEWEEKVEKQAQERHRLKELELLKQLEDTKKTLAEAQRKAQQGSQQNQGEVLELDLEKTLREVFAKDRVEPVGKGVSGADIVQYVCSPNGTECGIILWEIKQTKNWTEGWVSKFKDDLRAQKANVPVLVTTALPKGIEGFGWYNGIWVTEPKYASNLAVALRRNLLGVAYERAISAGKGKKSELLFEYVSSHEFRQRVEALVEVFSEMQEQITKERASFEKQWKQREGQLKRLLLNTAGMYGEMQGLVGSAMPEIKGLEFGTELQLEDGEEKERTLF
ncbi:MAG: DUF2130 domain-containing protein [Patescibacteria group bacterium]|jgi:hypothetical protein